MVGIDTLFFVLLAFEALNAICTIVVMVLVLKNNHSAAVWMKLKDEVRKLKDALEAMNIQIRRSKRFD